MKRSREPEEDIGVVTLGSDDLGASSPASSAPAAKIIELDDQASASSVEMRCSLPPHREVLVFKTYDEFESHYSKAHSYRCLECGRSMPSAHMLDLHHEECHDTFLALKREKGEHTYSCFVEGCERKCLTPQKRRMHLINKHMYPKNFFFAVTRDGIDGRRSMLLEGGHRRRRSSTATMQVRRESLAESGESNKMADARPVRQTPPASTAKDSNTDDQPSQPQQDVAMEDLATAMSSLQFIPRGVRFGRGGGKMGFAKR